MFTIFVQSSLSWLKHHTGQRRLDRDELERRKRWLAANGFWIDEHER